MKTPNSFSTSIFPLPPRCEKYGWPATLLWARGCGHARLWTYNLPLQM